MKRTRLTTIAALLSLMSLLVAAGPASAEIIDSHGMTGDWGYLPADDESSPAGKCGYSDRLADSYAHLRWIKVRAPRVAARDITGGQDHQQVSWQVIVQRSSASGWTTVKKSSAHSFTAYDDSSSAHSPIKVKFKATTDQSWRALILIKWLRNGSAEGWVKARIEFYGVKWTVGTPDYVFTDSCTGRAD